MNNLMRMILVSGLLALTLPLHAENTFKITIERGKGTSGKLTCEAAGVKDLICYWKADKRIPAGEYPHCSTTIMAEKVYKAVFIPEVKGFSGIFIHQGTKPEDSNGCIVAAKAEVERIWDAIPRDKKNTTVVIVDK